jgi:5'-phosphate synthase pdxT subunit
MRCSGSVAVKIGVLALQGDVSEHIDAFARAITRAGYTKDTAVGEVRTPRDLEGCIGLAIPGGESTTISRLIQKNGLYEPIRDFKGGIFATCAGMVLAASRVDDPRVKALGRIDVTVDRNAFGRQRESFEADLSIKGLDEPFHAVFIRAPLVAEAKRGVTVLSRIDQGIVAVSQGRDMALSFHPELGDDTRLHEMFLEKLL